MTLCADRTTVPPDDRLLATPQKGHRVSKKCNLSTSDEGVPSSQPLGFPRGPEVHLLRESLLSPLHGDQGRLQRTGQARTRASSPQTPSANRAGGCAGVGVSPWQACDIEQEVSSAPHTPDLEKKAPAAVSGSTYPTPLRPRSKNILGVSEPHFVSDPQPVTPLILKPRVRAERPSMRWLKCTPRRGPDGGKGRLC